MKTDKSLFELHDYGELAINDVIYNAISPDSNVLDIGCGNGVLGEFLKKNKNCYVCGLELDQDLVNTAKKKIDLVYQSNVEEISEISFDRKYDYIVCADILEHISDPYPVLKVIKSLLSIDGKLVVSIPNIANWRIRMELFFGDFIYRPRTITDPGHLRFYTKSTATKMLEDAGFNIEKILSKNSAYKRDFLIRWLGKTWPNLFAYQFIFVAKWPQRHKGTKEKH